MTVEWWLIVGWLLTSVAGSLALGRWFRWLRGDFDGQTPWEPTAIDRDVDVRWINGKIETRWNPK